MNLSARESYRRIKTINSSQASSAFPNVYQNSNSISSLSRNDANTRSRARTYDRLTPIGKFEHLSLRDSSENSSIRKPRTNGSSLTSYTSSIRDSASSATTYEDSKGGSSMLFYSSARDFQNLPTRVELSKNAHPELLLLAQKSPSFIDLQFFSFNPSKSNSTGLCNLGNTVRA